MQLYQACHVTQTVDNGRPINDVTAFHLTGRPPVEDSVDVDNGLRSLLNARG